MPLLAVLFVGLLDFFCNFLDFFYFLVDFDLMGQYFWIDFDSVGVCSAVVIDFVQALSFLEFRAGDAVHSAALLRAFADSDFVVWQFDSMVFQSTSLTKTVAGQMDLPHLIVMG